MILDAGWVRGDPREVEQFIAAAAGTGEGLPMSTHPLSAKSTRRVARQANEPTITRAWAASTGPLVFFATWDHRHGWLDRSTGEVEWDEPTDDPRGHVVGCYHADGDLLLDLDPFDDDGHWPTLKD